MKLFAVIVAGGSGSRMKSETPKQFLLLNGKPILMHTLQKFYLYNKDIHLIVVLPSKQIQIWKSLCIEHNFQLSHEIVEGGDSRFLSVKNGLSKISDDDSFVAIHDGVRPLVSFTVLENCFKMVEEKLCVIPIVDMVDSVRLIGANTNKPVDRAQYKLVQTPQVFSTSLIKKAYQQEYESSFTDDATVAEKLGHKIYFTEGNRENIKITNPLDLAIAETLMTRVDF